MLRPEYPYYLANQPVTDARQLDVCDKFTGAVVTRVGLANQETIAAAIAAADAAMPEMRALGAYQRKRILETCVSLMRERAEELAQVLAIEAGKPIRDSRVEVSRLVDTFQIASEEAVRLNGEVLPLDISERASGYLGMWKRLPIGPCSFISPFNFPLNLAAHKIAPAIAAGCPFVLKPASLTPVSSLILGEILASTELPAGAFSILPCARAEADLLATDERIRLLSFTGSPEVGWPLKARAGKKKVVLELGGNAACIVDETADLEDAAQRVVQGAFFQSGQSCISVQRVFVHAAVFEAFRALVLDKTSRLTLGDPKLETTHLGPLISTDDAIRVERWIQQACDAGARLLCGGVRNGAMLSPAWLEGVPRGQPLRDEEAFGPVAVLIPYQSFGEALNLVNDSRFGLQAGVFTRDIYRAQRAWNELDVGAVLIGEVPSFRVDSMPYGGNKDSGQGREGVRFALEDMTERRLLVIRTPPGSQSD
jgi:acyl-CoA reductase-like NAD-dependent aldehyde dehydrogenase